MTASSAPLSPTAPLDGLAPSRVTLRDVAERAGVNKACVSVVLNGAKSNAHVSSAARQRILEAAEELGYKRNGSMSSMAKGRFGCVALLLSTEPSFSVLPGQLWEGIYDELARKDIHLSMFRLPDSDLTDQDRLPKILREWMADGMLIDYTHNIPAGLHALIAAYSLPAIWINSNQEHDCVRPDDFGAGLTATNQLLSLGHKRITYVNLRRKSQAHLEHYSATDRYMGYIASMNAAGLAPKSMFAEDGPPEKHAELFYQVLQGLDRPTALVTYGREGEAALWAASRLGLQVPQDLSIVSLSPGGGQWSGTSITSYVVPEFEMGQCASRLIQEKINAPTERFPAQVLPFHFVESASVGGVKF